MSDAKPLTTAEVESCCRCDQKRLLATTRALETAQTALAKAKRGAS